jgi:pyruvate/2-oxoglutarate dehydrogenase complex dihydrolipoamide dehydrogenase (E3) component
LQDKRRWNFALGDCNGKGFTHTSYNDFQIVEEYILGDKKRKISDKLQLMDCLLIRRKSRNDKKKKQKKGFDILIASRPMSKIARAKEKRRNKRIYGSDY